MKICVYRAAPDKVRSKKEKVKVKGKNWQASTIILRIYSIADPPSCLWHIVRRRGYGGWHADFFQVEPNPECEPQRILCQFIL